MTFNGYNYTYTYNALSSEKIAYSVSCTNATYDNLTANSITWVIYPSEIHGYVYSMATGKLIPDAKVTLRELWPGDYLYTYNATNGSFILNMSDPTMSVYLIQAVWYDSDGVARYCSPMLPPKRPPSLRPGETKAIGYIDLYLVDATTLNITSATQDANPTTFSVEVFYKNIPVASCIKVNAPLEIVVQANNNYTLGYFKMELNGTPSKVISVNANDLPPGSVYNISLDLTAVSYKLNGTILLNGVGGGIDYLGIEVYTYAGDVVPTASAIPFSNSSINATNGYYELTLPADTKMEIIFYAKDGDKYYIGQLHNIQLSNDTTMNVTLQQAAGIPTWNAFLQTNLPKVSLVFLRVDRVC